MNTPVTPEPIWVKGLSEYISKCRESRPIPLRKDLLALEEQMCRINGGAVINWFKKYGPNLLDMRSQDWLFGKELDKDPYIIFVTDITGLVAMAEIFSPLPPRTFFILHEEFENWKDSESFDKKYHEHVWASSFFSDDVDESLISKAREKYPIAAGSSYLFHHEGTMYAESAGLGVVHVWEWRGSDTPILLEESAEQWVS
jgi:hypothetical protein